MLKAPYGVQANIGRESKSLKNSPYIPYATFFLPAHAQERLLDGLKIAIKPLLPVRRSRKQVGKKKEKKKWLTSTRICHEAFPPRLHGSFWMLFC